ncbi:hypothetical protein KFE25_014178 [Diacronema lutheri]|uniref:Uncharacterized protein n=1 Tax=Diacronema lutheri TaxID=2081491 RepID=A0A8J5XAS7_DIALT|nr:hypothetical protein KFE25_014178 [Diacronema lutheri]
MAPRAIAMVAFASAVGMAQEAGLAAIAGEYAAAAPAAARALLDVAAAVPGDRAPTVDAPFVFFHLRKSAGTLIRKELVAQAMRRKLPTFVPCHTAPCDTYGAGDFHAAVIGGHLYFSSVAWALRRGANPNPALRAAPSANFSCFTILRRPLARVESCWNFRMRGRRGPRARLAARLTGGAGALARRRAVPKPFIAMGAAELREALPLALDEYGHGCNNEALRIFADAGQAETTVNNATAADRRAAPALLDSALRNMQRCVVGVLERCEETVEALSATYPWIPRLPCARRANSYGANVRAGGALAAGLSYAPDALAEVARQNALEEHVYAVANAMLDAQLAMLRARGWAAGPAAPAV